MDPAGRRCFDHMHAEISVALGRVLPRYALWMHLKDLGLDPDALTRDAATRFCEGHLDGLLVLPDLFHECLEGQILII